MRGDCAFRIDGARAVALDRGRREIGPAEIRRDPSGYVSVVPRKGAFSYLVLPDCAMAAAKIGRKTLGGKDAH